MSFSTLPAELLGLILEDVTLPFLRQHPAHLFLTRSFHALSLTLLIQNLSLTSHTLSLFPFTDSGMLTRFRAETRRVRISLSALEREDPYTHVRNEGELQRWRAWRKSANATLERVLRFLQTCSKVEEVVFVTGRKWDRERPYWTADGDWISGSNFQRLLVLGLHSETEMGRQLTGRRLGSNHFSALTVLDLDMYGASVADSEPEDDDDDGDHPGLQYGDGVARKSHACSLISRHLPTLKKLHVYLPHMCPELLQLSFPSLGAACSDTTSSNLCLPLQDLVIKLASRGPAGELWNYAVPCTELHDTGPKETRDAFLEALGLIVQHAPGLKTARLLWYPTGYSERCLQRRAFRLHGVDCISGKQGVMVDESDPCSELVDDEEYGPGEGAAEGWGWGGLI